MNIDVSNYKMTEEDLKKFKEFKKSGNKYLEEEGKGILSFVWSEPFANMLQAFNFMIGRLNFSKPFRVIVDYDPEQKRTLVRHYAPEYPPEFQSHIKS